jgi:uncharacterized protein (DUF1499 family)
MTTTTAPAAAGTSVFRQIAGLGLVLAVAALLLLAAGPLGWRAGWWRYSLAFATLMPYAFYCGVAAMVVSVIGLIGGRTIGRRGLVMALLGLAIGGVAAYFPWHANQLRGVYPPMHDITTDFTNPPSLDFAAAARQAELGAPPAYPGAETAALQQKFYPGIAPAMLDLPPAQAFDTALAVARARGWTILVADTAAGVIDGYDRSFWFGFTDDIAIRVTASESGSRVDIRSASRQGRGDFGVNATRVRAYLAMLTTKP